MGEKRPLADVLEGVVETGQAVVLQIVGVQVRHRHAGEIHKGNLNKKMVFF